MSTFSDSLKARLLGEGPEVLVLSHGFGCDQTSWKHLLPMLSRRYRVMLYDLACAGSVADSVFDVRRHNRLDGYVDDLLMLLDGYGIDSCALVGHSVSGMIGMLAAIKAPQRFSQILAIGTSARYLDTDDYVGGFTRQAMGQIFDAIETNYRGWVRTFAPIITACDVNDPATLEFTHSLMSLRPDIALLAAQAIFLGDWRDRLASCAVPVTILQSQVDPAVPQAAAEFLHRHLPSSTLELMDTRGHLPHLSHPQQVARVLRRHLALFPPLELV